MAESGIEYSDVHDVATRLNELQATVMELAATDAVIGTNDPVAKYVLHGTRPHDIYPRQKKALFWAGAEHPSAHVSHPGYKGNDFLNDGVDAAMPEMVRGLADEVALSTDRFRAIGVIAVFKIGLDAALNSVRSKANTKTGKLRDSFTARWSK